MPRVLAFCAHPDDVEFRCAGTLALLGRAGWDIGIATVTGGSAGSTVHGPDETRRIRLDEARAAASLIGAEYSYAGGIDTDVDFNHDLRVKVVHVLRQFRPDVVITLPYNDYHPDHTETSRLVRAACFYAPIPNYPEQTLDPINAVPHLYYTAVERDWRGRPAENDFVVDITSVIDVKQRMLECHESQREWLLSHHGTADIADDMRRRGRAMGESSGYEFGEGFWQHLGMGFPPADPIGEALTDRVARIAAHES